MRIHWHDFSGNRWTKHYYIGSERIASRTGIISGGFTGINDPDNPNVTPAGPGNNQSVNYAAMCRAEEDSAGLTFSRFGVPYGVQRTIRGNNTGHLVIPIHGIDGREDGSADSAEAGKDRNHPNTLGDGQVYFFFRDHLGSTLSVTDSVGNYAQQVEYTPWGEVFVERQIGSSGYETPFLFNGKELDEETGLYYYGARYYDPKMSVWYSTDPMEEKYPWVSTYSYTMNNPIKYIEPFGKEPVYNRRGKYLGSTSEGFTGDVLIYSGKDNIHFEDMTRKELFNHYYSDIIELDMELKYAAGGIDRKYLPNIWKHIASHFEGLQVYDEKFSVSSIANGMIYYNPRLIDDHWETNFSSDDPSFLPIISGSGNNYIQYENTVENIASSIIVHEWYSHGKKYSSDDKKSHRLAYKNVINYKFLWNKTTDKYKYFNLYNLWYYT